MSFSLKSHLSYSGLSAAVEGAATSAYGRIRSYMEEMMGAPPVVLTIFLMVLVRPTPDGKTPDRSFNPRFNHDGLGASEEAAAIDNYHRLRAFMGDALSDLAADVSVDLTMTVRPTLELPSMIVSEVSEVMESDVHKELRAEKEVSAALRKSTLAAEEAAKKLRAEVDARHKREMAEVDARHKREMADRDKRYTDALGPLLGARDRMLAECEKKVEEADRKGYAMGYAFADQKWNPVYKAVCEELAAARSDLERLNAENKEMELAALILSKKLAEETASSKALREKAEEDKQMVQRHLKEVAKENAEMTAWEIERLRKENKDLLDLVGPTITHIKSNPELFGGEAVTAWRPVSEEETARAEKFLKGLGASPRPPAIVRLPQETARAETFLKGPVFRDGLVEAEASSSQTEGLYMALTEEQYKEKFGADRPPPSPLPGLVEAEASSSQTEGLYMALTEEQYKEKFGADRPPPIVPDQPKVCGAAGCIDCPPAAPEPKTNYNHRNWPSPMTKRFAKHLATHSGLRSPWRRHDPKAIKTHEDALEFIAKRVNISVENLLGWTMKQYQTTYEPWTLVEGPSKFNMGTAPATWWL